MKTSKKKGLTLIELIIVITIIGIISMIALPRVSEFTQKARLTSNASSAKTIYTAALSFDVFVLQKNNTPNYPKQGVTDYSNTGYNPGTLDLAPYIDSNVTIISGIGQPGTNAHGHKAPTDYGEACIHIIRGGVGASYVNAGITSSPEKDLYIIEMYDPTAEKITDKSEDNVKYYFFPEIERSN